jgi:outer membrane protein assembly factor BamB
VCVPSIDAGPTVVCGPDTVLIDGECVSNIDAGPSVVCGPGTVQLGNECVPVVWDAGDEAGPPVTPLDAGLADGAGADSRSHDAALAADAGPPSEATSFAINPAHDNAQPSDRVASPLTVQWTASLGGTVSFPLVADGRVLVAVAATQPNVRALDLATGQLLWGPTAFGKQVWLAYDQGSVFAVDGDGNLAALDAATGHRLWATQLTLQYMYASPPVATGGLVFVNGLGEGGTTYAIDGQTGATRWTAGTFDGSFGTMAVAGGIVYEAEACDQLSAFQVTTGVLNWYHSTSCTGGGGAAPSFYQGLIWVRDWALGDVIINSSGGSAGTFSSSVVPAYHAGTAFYLSSGVLSAVDIQNDTLKWSFSGDGQLCTSPVVAGGGGQVFVGSQSGNVYELDEAAGTQRSVSAAGDPVTCGSETEAMAVAAGHLLVPAGSTLIVY